MMMNRNTVTTAGEVLQAVEWPGMREVEVPRMESGDCMIVCAGFEDRSVEVLRRVRDSGARDFSLGVIEYRPSYRQNKLHEITGISEGAGLEAKRFLYDRENPAGAGEDLTHFAEVSRRVVVDISGMSRLLIVQILVALLAGGRIPVTVVYGEAKTILRLKANLGSDIRAAAMCRQVTCLQVFLKSRRLQNWRRYPCVVRLFG